MRSAKEILHPDNDWETAYPELGKSIELVLSANTNKSWSTADLAQILWPSQPGVKDHRWRLFKALKALAAHDMATYVRAGKIRRVFGKLSSPTVWQHPGYDL